MSLLKRIVFLCLFVPIAFLWDMVYLLVKSLYDLMTVVDKKGGDWLEKLRVYLWEKS